MSQEVSPRIGAFSRLLRIAAILLAHSAALFFVLTALVKIAPIYWRFFDEQGVALPLITQRILLISEFCVAFWFLIFPAAMVVDAAIVFLLAFAASRTSWLLSAYSHVCLLAASAALVYLAVWLGHPMSRLI